MSAGPERPIGLVPRLLLAVVGLAALVAAFIVGVAQLGSATRASPIPTLVLCCSCVVVAIGGALLVRGAVRGRIRFRRIRRTDARS
jgi:di/tricarboxylate transporter